MTYTLCTSGAIVAKCGANVSAVAAASDALVQQFALEAEDFVNLATRYDWTKNFTAEVSGAIVQYAISDAVASIAGTSLIAYDMSGYMTRGEAEDLINILYDRAGRIIEYLKVYKKPEENA